MDIFEDKLLGWIESNALFKGGARVLLAVSGGADSVAMAHVLHQLRKNGKLTCDFVIGHVNHCLRGDESDADEAFVKQLGQSLGMGVVSQKFDVKPYAVECKHSIETAGRLLRLKTLAAMVERHDCGCIATAHHADDQAETLIHRLMRGTGFRGLCGIWPVSEVYGATLVRPMLEFRRAEIIQYCKDHGFVWQEDASNVNLNFTRNHIRHRLLPALEEESGAIADKLGTLSLKCQRFQLFTEKSANRIIDKGSFNPEAGQFCIDQKFLTESAPWVFYEVVRHVLIRLGAGLRRYTREHFAEVRKMMDTKQSRLTLPENIAVEVSDGELTFSRVIEVGQRGHSPPYEGCSMQLTPNRTIQFGPWEISARMFDGGEVSFAEFRKAKDSSVEWFDAERVAGPVVVRCRREGDRFWPIGARDEKKVGRFLIDAQLDPKTKQEVVIVDDVEKILWVAPIRMCEQARVTPQTKQMLEIRVLRKTCRK